MGAAYREACKMTQLLQAHARQAIRTQMPTIDGATTHAFREKLLKQEKEDQPVEFRELYASMVRTASALVMARGAANWHAVRTKAMKQAGQWARQADGALREQKEAGGPGGSEVVENLVQGGGSWRSRQGAPLDKAQQSRASARSGH